MIAAKALMRIRRVRLARLSISALFLVTIAASAAFPSPPLPARAPKAAHSASPGGGRAPFFPNGSQLPPGVPQTITDDLGRVFRIPAAVPGRIVSMAPNITEILFALGLGDRIVGATRFCDYPPEALAIRRIGGLVDPNIEIIESLRPDLILSFRGNPLRVLTRLHELRLPVFILDIGGGLDQVPPLLARIGLVTRREKEAAELGRGLMARLASLDDHLRGITKKPRVFFILHSQGLWTAGGQGYLTDLAARAGAVNIAAGLDKKWVLYSRERIIRDDPDAIFILARSEADFEAARVWLAEEARLGGIAAVKSGRVYHLDENAASRFGPRLIDVAEKMARDLHPEHFEGAR